MSCNPKLGNAVVEGYLQTITNPATRRCHASVLKHLLEFCEEMGLGKPNEIDFSRVVPHQFTDDKKVLAPVDSILVEDFLMFKKKKGNSNQYLSHQLGTLRRFFKHLVALKILQSDPTLGIPPIKYAEKVNNNFLTWNEALKLLHAAANSRLWERNFAFVYLALWAGLRPEELRTLRVHNINFEGKTLRIESWVKGKTAREIALCDNVITAIKVYLNSPQRRKYRSDFLFLTQRGKPLTPNAGVNRLIKGLVKRAGLRNSITGRTTRHTFGTVLFHRGMKFPTISELMGHSKKETTGKYTHQLDSLNQDSTLTPQEDVISKSIQSNFRIVIG